MIELSIAVLHYNRWDLTEDCLTSVDQQDMPCIYEKILVDNGSTIQLPTTWTTHRHWKLARYTQNYGHIIGQNRCFESSKGSWMLFLANDVRLHSGCVEALWRHIHAARLGQLQPVSLLPTQAIDHVGMDWCWPGYGRSRTQLTDVWTPVVPSTCYLMSKSVWQQLGGFDGALTTSHEDVDFGLRLAQHGYRNAVVESAKITHLANATLRHMATHTKQNFHRDRVYVVGKHYKGFDKWLRLTIIGIMDLINSPFHR